MIRKQTGLLIFIFLILVGFAYYLNQQKKLEASEAAPTAGTTFVFDSLEGTAYSIEITSELGERVKVFRNPDGVWAIELPFEAEADQGKAEAAASQVASLRLVGEVEGHPDIFGLDTPAHVITVEFSGGSKHILEVGDNTPTNSGYYVRVDHDRIVITGLSGIDALTSLAFSPPFLNTPTPSPLPPSPTSAADSGTPSPASTDPSATPTP